MIQSASRRRGMSVVETAGRDQLPRVRREERVRLQRARTLQPLGCGVGSDVEEERRNAGVGEMRSDLGAHDAGAEDGDGSNHRFSVSR